MGLRDVTPTAALEAIGEYGRLGQDEFLERERDLRADAAEPLDSNPLQVSARPRWGSGVPPQGPSSRQ